MSRKTIYFKYFGHLELNIHTQTQHVYNVRGALIEGHRIFKIMLKFVGNTSMNVSMRHMRQGSLHDTNLCQQKTKQKNILF